MVQTTSWPQWLKPFLAFEDAEQISTAVQKAEMHTSGEIVPVIVRHSAVTGPFWHKFLSSKTKRRLVFQRAELEFYRLNMSSTKDRTGIILFVSLEERQAVVLADKAISTRLPAETWREVITLLLAGIREKNAAKGFTDAIQKCGEILSQTLPAQKHNPDELCNRLVIRD